MSKNPTVAALPPDHSLWIVSYSQAEPQNCFPTSQLPLSPQARQQLTERQWIESQGRLERQDFMLHDREKWPQLNIPGRGGAPGAPSFNQSMYQQNPMAHIGNPRFSGNFYQQAQQGQVGPSPAKRQRQHPPSHMPASVPQDTSIEDEENVLLGDLLDHLTQRDISLTRYMQHHEWMEEIFSSPYATGQIVPMDLGFGLMGELAGLTKDLFEPPTSDQEKSSSKSKDMAAAYKKVTPDQLQEFEKRIQTHKEKEQAEILRMKEEHARRMDSLRKSKSLVKAEKKLRNASWNPSESSNDFWRMEKTNDQDAGQIVHQVEELLGGSIQPQKEATMISEGGYRKEEPKTFPDTDMMGMQLDGAGLDVAQTTQSASGASAEPPRQSEPVQPPVQEAVPQIPQQQPESAAPSVPDTTMENMEAMDTGNFSLPDDMDLDTGTFNFDTPKADVSTPGMSNWPSQHQQPQISAQAQQTGAHPQTDTSNQPGSADLYGAGDTNFGDFDTGDGLIDFDGGAGGDLDFSMDNSAFGDAFHGTEAHHGQEGGTDETQ